MIATQIVHWPGKSTPACDEHTEKLKRLGNMMGFGVSSTLCVEEVECSNCANKEKK